MLQPTPNSPADAGWRMPAEWEPHAGTWFTWPRPEGISFPDKFEPVPGIYANLIRELVPHEDANINVWHREMEEIVRGHLTKFKVPLDRVHFHHFPAYEPWCRDHGPVFLVRDGGGAHERAVVDWGYNAWGNKYPPCDLDDAIPQHVAKVRGVPLFSPGIVMEGGALDVNGLGAVLTTEACLLNPNRNPHLTKPQIEQYLCDYLGVTAVLWLNEGIVGDDTDGHIDDIARFVDPRTVVAAVEEDPSDENFHLLQENLRILKRMRDQDFAPLKIVELPMPGVVELDGQRLPASYVNFYIANNVVLVPTYRHNRNDQRALDILQGLFTSRKVIGIDSTHLIWGLGSFHCISQQEPA